MTRKRSEPLPWYALPTQHWPHTEHQTVRRVVLSGARAEADARRVIESYDAIAAGAEYFRRLAKRGSECRLTRKDHAAIRPAAKV